MKDALIVIHVDTNKRYSDIVSGIRTLAEEYLHAGKTVYELLMPNSSAVVGLDGIVLVQHGPGAAPGIDQILDLKLMLMEGGMTQVEACGMNRYNCVANIVEQLQQDTIEYEHEPEHEAKIKLLEGYKLDVTILEHLCNGNQG
jgi:hypothetical protein